ncbi:MAG: hypothetical protein QNJ37_10810 [Crocosphaera sp.]|nr:hypothetical protein [Crocosphaera sp.]
MSSPPLMTQLKQIKQQLYPDGERINPSEFLDSPYKGLMPYLEEDAPYFFGREKWTRIITDNLMSSRLTVLYGTSGVGKSSLLKAGVVYQFNQLIHKNLQESGYPELAVIVFNRWPDDPVRGLVEQVKKTITKILPDVPLPEPKKTLTETLETWAKILVNEEQGSGKLFIILDQFEEYFLYHSHEIGENTFARQFSDAVNQTGLPVNFIISIRENALARLDFFKGSIPHLLDNYLRIPHLDEQSAVDAIRKPIRVFNQQKKLNRQAIAIETELVEAVIKQVTVGQVSIGESGRGTIERAKLTERVIETPYLQLVMTRLWQEDIIKQRGNRLQLATLNSIGGAENIVKQHLSQRMRRLSRRERNIAIQVFQYLVTPGGTKIAYPIIQLAQDIAVAPEELQALLQKLCQPQQYILRAVGPSPNEPNVERYEIFHDTLAPAILTWRQKYQQRQERNKWRRRTLAASAIALFTTGLLGIAEYQRTQATLSEIKAILAYSNSLVVSNQLFDALIEDLIVYKKLTDTQNSWTFPIWHSLFTQVREDKQEIDRDLQRLFQLKLVRVNERNRLNVSENKEVVDVGFSNNGQILATASRDGTIKLWNLDGQLIQSLPENNHQGGHFWRFSFSPNDRLLAAGSTNKNINLWSIDDNQIRELKSLEGHKGWIWDVNFHPTQPILASASGDGTVKLWRFDGQQFESEPIDTLEVSEIDRDNVPEGNKVIRTLSFSPDGKILAIGIDTGNNSRDVGTIQLWTLEDQKLQLLKTFEKKHDDWIWDINFSPNGKIIGTASRDGTVKLWNLEGEELQTFNGYKIPFTSINFIVYGQKKEIIIMAASHDKTIKFWNFEGEELTTLKGHEKEVWRAIFSPDGQTLATASKDGTVKLWNLKDQDLLGHQDLIYQVSFSPDGQTLATAGKDNTVKLWQFDGQNTYDLQYIKTIKAHKDQVTSVTFRPDDSTFATASFDTIVKHWNLENDQPIEVFDKHTEEIWKVEFNPKLPMLGTVSNDGTAKLWNFDGTIHRDFNHFLEKKKDKVVSLSFSPNGQILATVMWVLPNSEENDIMLWDVNGGEKPIQEFASLQKHWLMDIDFSHDSTTLATASKDGTVKLWNLEGENQTPSQENRSKINHDHSIIRSVEFSPTDPFLLTASDDQTVKLWTMDGQLKQTFFGHQGSVISASFSPDGQFIASSGGDRRVILWDRDLTLEDLWEKSCDWIGGYLQHNPNVSDRHKSLCNSSTYILHQNK